MRIFNGTNSLLTLPLSGNQKLEIHPKSVSQEFMGSTDFISMIVTSLKNTEIAIIVSGPYELNICSNVPTAVHYVVQSLDEAIIRLGLKKPEPKVAKEEECKCEKCKAEEKKVEEPIKEETKPAEPEITKPEPEPVQEEVTEVPEEVVEVAEEEKPAEEVKPKKSKKKARK